MSAQASDKKHLAAASDTVVNTSEIKSFAYNYIKQQALLNEAFLPFLTKNSNGWNSTLVVANTEASPTDLIVDIFTSDGFFAKNFQASLPANGVYILNLAEQSSLIDGRYQAHIGSTTTKIATEVHTESAYMAMSYTSIGALARSLIIPIVEKKAHDWNTTFYVHNSEEFSGEFTITYYAEDNPEPVLTIPGVVIAPLQSLEFETLAESGLPDGFIGYAHIESNRTIGGVVARKNYVQESAMMYPAADSFIMDSPFMQANGFTSRLNSTFVQHLEQMSLPVATATTTPSPTPMTTPSPTPTATPPVLMESPLWFVPLVTKRVGHWGSSFLQVRAIDDEIQLVNAAISFYDNTGWHVVAFYETILEYGETRRYYLDSMRELPLGFSGSAVVWSDAAVWVAVGQEKEAGGDLFGYLTDAEVNRDLYIPYVSKGGTPNHWTSEINIQNASAAVVNVTVALFEANGTNTYTTTQDVAPGASYVFDLSAIDSLPSNFEGQAIITGSEGAELSAIVVGSKQQATGDHARVVKDGVPRPNASVFYNGQKQGETDAEGLVSLEALAIGQSLVVIDPVDETHTERAAHNGRAYSTYTTNLNVNGNGLITPDHVVTSLGRQILTTSIENTLVLFNIVVSVEWDADEAYLAMLERAFGRASDYLYDVTDGQMAFGEVAIYDNATHWADADFQISAKNTVRPYAFVGGITSEDTAHSIRVGRFWDGDSGERGAWDEPNGYRTLIHEFGHYALYLQDEYFLRTFDENGHFSGQIAAACTGLEVVDNGLDATNASMMFYQYNASELADSDRWNINCQNSEQARVNGEPDWRTVVRYYGDEQAEPRWVLQTPTSRGSVMAGPEQFPQNLLPFPEIEIYNEGGDGVARQLQVYDASEAPVPNALVALYTTPGSYPIAIDQGLTNVLGELTIYGALVGDIVQVASLDGALAGSVLIDERVQYEIELASTSIARFGATDAALSPHLRLIPGSEGDSLFLEVHGVPASGSALDAFVVPAEGGGAPQGTQLAYSASKEAYTGEVDFAGVGLGSGAVRVIGIAGNRLVRINSNYNLQAVSNRKTNDLTSEDGNFQLHIDGGSLLNEVDGYATVLPTGFVPSVLPDGKETLGSAYEVRLSGAATNLEKPGLLTMYYHPEVVGEVEDLVLYWWDAHEEAWVLVEGEIDERNNSVTGPATQLGIYALGGRVSTATRIYLPLLRAGS